MKVLCFEGCGPPLESMEVGLTVKRLSKATNYEGPALAEVIGYNESADDATRGNMLF